VGDAVTVMPSRVPATIEKLLLGEHSLIKAQSGQAITVVLKENIDVARGDLIVLSSNLCEVSDHFEVNLVWLDRDSGFVGRSYVMKVGTVTMTANITSLKYKVNVNTYERVAGKRLEVNDVARVTIKVNRPIPFENYSTNHSLGGFILIDRATCHTVAAGMIEFGLRRSVNINPQEMTIDKQARRKLNEHKSKVLWLTGISGSGESTIANALEKRLYIEGVRTYVLDGDNIRSGLNSDLGFTDADRIENVRRLTEVARLFVDAGFITIVASISPFRSERIAARGLFESDEFYEIYVDTPLPIAESRDPKGLYLKARRGEIPNFTGIGSAYEPPLDPDVRVETANKSIETVVDELMDWMKTI